jgi:hypothetical protein
MAIKSEDCLDVQERCKALGCQLPETLALLPSNFATAKDQSELVYEKYASTIRKLWAQSGVKETRIEGTNKPYPTLDLRSYEINLCVFVGASLLSQDPAMFQLALGTTANYFTDVLKGAVGHRRMCKVEVIVEEKKGNRYVKLTYEGDCSGLSELGAAIGGLRNGREKI